MLTRVELRARSKEVHSQLMGFVECLTDADLMAPRGEGEWTLKDILAHIADCYEEATTRLRLIVSGRSDEIRWYEPGEIDAKNAERQARDVRLTPSVVRRRLESTFDRLLHELDHLTDDQAGAGGDRSAVVWLPGWTTEHVAEHLADLDSSVNASGWGLLLRASTSQPGSGCPGDSPPRRSHTPS